jgi:hypothetical protein
LHFFFFENVHVLGLFIPKKQVKSEKKNRLSRGVAGVADAAVRVLVEICVDDIQAVLRATDLRFQLLFVIWAGCTSYSEF